MTTDEYIYMNKRSYFIIIIILIIVIVFTSSVYTFYQSPTNESMEKIKIVVTIVPQAEFVEKIGGDLVSVTILVPPGASPHTYEPTPSQMKDVAQADMYAIVGSGIEFELVWMQKIIETNPQMLLVDCSQDIHLIDTTNSHEFKEHEDEHRGKDPHIWLSPRNAIIIVENIYRGFITLDPDNREYYSQNKDSYIEILEELDRDLVETFSNLKIKKFMVYHPSWGYFAYDYNLEQIPIEEEGKLPTPEGIAHLIDQAKEHNIKVIFATPEFETKTAETIANEIGGSVILISPLSKDYIINLTEISEEITKSLQ